MDYKPDICVYHGDCDDGFGAAWAVKSKWPDVEFFPAHYGKTIFPHGKVQWADKHVLFVDFSLSSEGFLYLLQEVPMDIPGAASVVVIDHHKTAESAMSGLPMFDGTQEGLGQSFRMSSENNGPAIAVWFDMSQSGATMAWQFVRGTNRQVDPCPNILSYVEDRDLWRFAFGDKTRKFSAALRTYPHDFAVWDKIASNPDDLIVEGEVILRAHQKNVRSILKESFFQEFPNGLSIPCCNAPYHYASDVAHELLAKFPDAPFASCWFKRGDGKVQFSLRSENHRTDVSEIAKKFGGGGHRNAAGFQVDEDPLITVFP